MPEGRLLRGELQLGERLNTRFFALLSALQSTGSINRAARTAGLSYKGAWLALEAASNLAHQSLWHTRTGGARGGGTELTDAGRALLQAWAALQAAHQQFLSEQEQLLAGHPALAGLLRRMSMKTSARNQFVGRVTALRKGPLSVQASMEIAGGIPITASVTREACDELGLKKGVEAIALVKASAIVLVTDFAGYRLSARNQIAGTVSRIERGAVSSLVVLTLPGGATLSATITQDALQVLGLKLGADATAVFKASVVMLAVAG